MMRNRTWIAGAVAALMLTPVWGGAQESHRISGDRVAVYNIAGTVEVVRGSGSDVVVRMTRGGADASSLDVRIDEIRGRETLVVMYPADEIVYPEMGRRSRTDVRVRDDGTFYGDGPRGDRVRVRGSGDGMEAWADLVVEVPSGKDLSLHLAVGSSSIESVDGDIAMDTGSGEIHAVDVSGSLDLDTGSGEVTVRGMDGYLNVDTGSGSVSLRDVVGDIVNVDTGSGQVTAAGIRAEEVNVDTGSGSIEMDEVSADAVIVDTGSGSVDLVLLTDVHRLDVDTGSGSVTVYGPADLGGELEVDTGSGGIDVDFAVQVRTVRRDHMEGVLGDGRGEIRIDTGSGSIRLLRR